MGASGAHKNVFGASSQSLCRPSRAVVCDARPLMRLGLSVAFSRVPDIEITAEAVTSDVLAELVARVKPELVMIHTRVPPAGALVVVRDLRTRFKHIRVLAFADSPEPLMVAELLRQGATSVAHVSQPVASVADAARSTLRGSCYLAPYFDRDTIQAMLRDSPLQALTPRELEIFILLGRGHSNTGIADRLYISLRTAETHRQRIMRKLHTHTITELVLLAKRLEIIGWAPA